MNLYDRRTPFTAGLPPFAALGPPSGAFALIRGARGGIVAHSLVGPYSSSKVINMRRHWLVALLLVVGSSLSAQRRLSWSPDGSRLVTAQYDTAGLFVITVATGAQARLFASGAHDTYPDWSHDGRHIVFASDSGGHSDIYVVDADGTHLRQLTRNSGKQTYPSWSPDDSQIAFDSNRGGKWQIFVMNADGSSQRQVTQTQFHEFNPEWSPDGKRIVWEAARGVDKDDIYTVDVGGEHETKVATPQHAQWPHWSADGRIVFCQVRRAMVDGRLRGVGAALWVMAPDGTGLRQIADGVCDAAVSRDGRRIAYVSGRSLRVISGDW